MFKYLDNFDLAMTPDLPFYSMFTEQQTVSAVDVWVSAFQVSLCLLLTLTRPAAAVEEIPRPALPGADARRDAVVPQQQGRERCYLCFEHFFSLSFARAVDLTALCLASQVCSGKSTGRSSTEACRSILTCSTSRKGFWANMGAGACDAVTQ
jgi:hypothetical protein